MGIETRLRIETKRLLRNLSKYSRQVVMVAWARMTMEMERNRSIPDVF